MAIRVQKKWSQLGNPTKIGNHNAPQGLGVVIEVSTEHLSQVQSLGGEATVVLEALETESFIPNWKIIEIREA
jgi:hypothetical protein